MARWLRQSTSVDVPIGPFVDQTDGFTAETALTLTQPDIRLKKNGGAWAQKNAAQTLSHEENGWYEVTLDATDTNTLGLLTLAVNESGALPVWHEFLVVPANIWDSFFSTDLLQVDVQQFGGGAGTFSGGRPEVNTSHAAGTAWNSGAIVAATLATDTITAAKVAADTVAKIADGVWDEATSGHQTGGTTGRSLTLAGSILGEFTLGGVPTTTVIRLTGASAVNDYYNDMAVMITSGALIGQTRPVLDYDGATGDLTVDEPFTSAPAAGVTVAILAQHTHPITQISARVWDEDATGHQTQGTFGQAIGDPGADADTIFGLVNSISAAVAAIDPPTANENADALLDRSDGVESGLTVRQALRVALAALAGVSLVSGGNRVYRSTDNAKDRITATVLNGDRSLVVLDKS